MSNLLLRSIIKMSRIDCDNTEDYELCVVVITIDKMVLLSTTTLRKIPACHHFLAPNPCQQNVATVT